MYVLFRNVYSFYLINLNLDGISPLRQQHTARFSPPDAYQTRAWTMTRVRV